MAKILVVVDEMSVNTCKAVIEKGGQITTSKGVLCTKDAELHVFMLTCPR